MQTTDFSQNQFHVMKIKLTLLTYNVERMRYIPCSYTCCLLKAAHYSDLRASIMIFIIFKIRRKKEVPSMSQIILLSRRIAMEKD
jgi:hypothetical protein